MGLLTPTKRVYHRWRSVLPLYDGRECPDCAAVICGRDARRKHREWHMAAEQQEESVWAAIERLARELRIPVVTAGHQDQGDKYDRVDLRAMPAPDYDDDEEDDE